MLTSWQADGLTIAEGLKDFSIQSNRPIAVDVARQLVTGETEATNATAKAWLLGELDAADTDAAAILVDDPAITGTVISQQIDGSAMTVGRIYKIVLTHGPSNNQRSVNLALRAVE
jgi:hypothetical protein